MITMLKRILIGCILLALSACSSKTNVFSDPLIPVEISAGSRFTIELDSNATTGYSWVIMTPMNDPVIRLVKSDYINPQTGLTGAGGKQIWVFEAVQTGTTTISLAYKRSWEAAPPIQTAIFTITVK
jgi:inhibitor of cysteine peptidase